MHGSNPFAWPLQWLGLEPGRAVANARPELGRSRRDRLAEFAYIAGRHAGGDGRLALIGPDRQASAPDGLSIIVFDGAQLVRHHATLDSTLRESIGTD